MRNFFATVEIGKLANLGARVWAAANTIFMKLSATPWPAKGGYLVAAAIASTLEKDRRSGENMKIACGRKHFGLSQEVVFKDVSRLEGLVQ